MNLYSIHDEIERILATEVDRETGEITDDTLAALNELGMERDAKLLAIAAYMKGELAEAEAVKVEAKRLAARATGHTKRALRLHGWLVAYFETNRGKLSDARSVIQWRKNPPKVEVLEVALLPDELTRTEVTVAADKKAIGDLLKAGEKVGGARLVHSSRLEVK